MLALLSLLSMALVGMISAIASRAHIIIAFAARAFASCVDFLFATTPMMLPATRAGRVLISAYGDA